jgi:hypothetical protein
MIIVFSPLISSNLIEFSRFALEALRRNEKEFHVAETEADMWLQIQKFDKDLLAAENVTEISQLQLNCSKLKNNLSQRTKSMLEFPEYLIRINEILVFPGLRSDFKGANFEIFLRGHTIEVCSIELGAPSSTYKFKLIVVQHFPS